MSETRTGEKPFVSGSHRPCAYPSPVISRPDGERVVLADHHVDVEHRPAGRVGVQGRQGAALEQVEVEPARREFAGDGVQLHLQQLGSGGRELRPRVQVRDQMVRDGGEGVGPEEMEAQERQRPEELRPPEHPGPVDRPAGQPPQVGVVLRAGIRPAGQQQDRFLGREPDPGLIARRCACGPCPCRRPRRPLLRRHLHLPGSPRGRHGTPGPGAGSPRSSARAPG